MVNYSKKYHTNPVFYLLFALFLITVAICIVFNIILAKSNSAIQQTVSAYTKQNVSIKSIYYLPPNFLIIKNVSFGINSDEKNTHFLVVPSAVMRFSLLEFITKRRISVSSISLYNPQANSHKLFSIIKDNFKEIIDFLKHLPKQDIEFRIKDARLDSLKEKGASSFISADLFFKIKGNSVSGFGRINGDSFANGKKSGRAMPWRYSFRGFLTQNGFSLSNLEVMRQNFYAKLWGGLAPRVFQMNGFIFANTTFSEPIYEQKLKKGRFSLSRPPALSSHIDLSLVDLCILDIDCRINFLSSGFQIERLNFLLNNNPVSLKGEVALSDTSLVDLAVSFGPAKLQNPERENLKKIDIALSGEVKDMAFNGKGAMHFDFIRKEKVSLPLQAVAMDFDGLNLNLRRYPAIRMSMGSLNLFCATENNDYRMAFRDLNAIVPLIDKPEKFIAFEGRLYDGFLKGQGWIDTAGSVPKINSIMKVRDVASNKLEGILVHFSKVFGKLDGNIYFSNYPYLQLGGKIDILNGYLHNFEFFKWLADFFTLPSLKRIDFNRASSDFFVSGDGAGLYKIDLDSQDVDLNGYFKLGMNDLVSSKISLILTRKLLSESPKFTRLLKLVSEEPEALTFKFQLSGNLHGMNFKWLKSDLKKELQDSIPNFIERKIERDVEEAIEAVSQSEQESDAIIKTEEK